MKYRIENLSKCLTPWNTKRCSTNHTACPVSFRFCLLLFQRIEQYGRLKWWTEFGGSLNRNEWYRRRWHFMDFNTFFSTLHSTFYLFLFYTQCIYFNSHNVIQCIINIHFENNDHCKWDTTTGGCCPRWHRNPCNMPMNINRKFIICTKTAYIYSFIKSWNNLQLFYTHRIYLSALITNKNDMKALNSTRIRNTFFLVLLFLLA